MHEELLFIISFISLSKWRS